MLQVAHRIPPALREYVYADEVKAAGNTVTASDFYSRAEAMFRIADYGIHDAITVEKLRIYGKIPMCFQKSWELRPETVETVEIPFEGKTMEAYFAIPDDCPADAPVLVMIPGATGFKEENFYLGGFQLKFNQPLDVCAEMSSRMECTDKLHLITCPLLIIHSHEDPIIGTEGAHRIYDMVSSEVKYYADYPGNAHCVNDQMDSAGCFGADWMVPRMIEAAKA